MKIKNENKIPSLNNRRMWLGCAILALLFLAGLWMTPVPQPVRYVSVPLRQSADSAQVSYRGLDLLLSKSEDSGLNIQVASNGEQISLFRDRTVRWVHCPDSVQIADLNGDKLPDAKLTFGRADDHAGAAMKRVYLISRRSQSYSMYSWIDLSDHPETDFNGDHVFELICSDSTIFDNQLYYKTQVYALSGDRLINVSLIYGYPKLIRIGKSPARNPILTEHDRRRFLSERPWQFRFR